MHVNKKDSIQYIDVLFCSLNLMQVKKYPSLDARLSDICISTSAAPTYLPAYYFENHDYRGNVHKFNLIDGGVAANNPVVYFT